MKTTTLRPSLLGLILLLSLPAGAAADDFTYTTNNGTITIASYTGPGGEVIIPASVGNLPVTAVGTNAFASSTNITKVLIPDSVTTIESRAFHSCKSLTNITMGGGLAFIGDLAFSLSSSLTNLTFPNGLAWIGDFAFSTCSSLSHIAIPASTTNIGIAPFSYCANVANIAVDPANSHYSSLDGVLFNKSRTILIECPSLKSGAYIVPEGVSQMRDYSFAYCTSLSTVSIPESVSNIGEGVFLNCWKLQNLNIPGSVTNIGFSAFLSCGSLVSITIPDGVISIGQSAFDSCRELVSITVPDSVTNLGNYSFYSCWSLASVRIGAGVRSIGTSVFESCRRLTNITFQTGLITIGDHAFLGCSALLDPVLPDKLTMISSNAFQGCHGLRNLVIPSSVVEIKSLAFYNCGGLTSISIGAGLTSLGPRAFGACPSVASFTVNQNNLNYSSLDGVLFDKSGSVLIQYSPASSRTTYAIPAGVTNLMERSFHNAGRLTSVAIPSSVVSIESYAFDTCTNLSRVFFQGNAPIVGTFIFVRTGLGSVYYEAGTTGWISPFADRSAFLWDPPSQMTYVTNGNALSITGYLGTDTIIRIPAVINGLSVTRIGMLAFFFFKTLTQVTIPSSVAYIESGAFGACDNLAGLFCEGNAPGLSFGSIFGNPNQIIYYLPGTSGWTSTYGGRPTAIWHPLIQTPDPSFGIRTNRFGFNITWASDHTVVVDASTDLAAPTWVPISTNALPAGSATFTDPDWTNYPTRFYRVRSQ